MGEEWKNKLYFGDNLDVMRKHIADESVDLIYLDPPFNSKATYNVLFQEKNGTAPAAQVKAFEDFWHWDEAAEKTYHEVITQGPKKLADLLQALMAFLGRNDMMAYLTMMAIRLIEIHRVLKPTGSIYLHCDPTASHYLKLLLDAVFGPANFRNEIIWRRTNSNNNPKRFGPIHQTIFYYVKTDEAPFYQQRGPYLRAYVETFFKYEDARGRYRLDNLTGPGVRHGDSGKPWRGYDPSKAGRHWQPASYLYKKYKELTGDDLAQYPLLERLDKLDQVGLIHWSETAYPSYKSYLADRPGTPLQDIWAYQPGTKGCIYGNPEAEIDQDVKWLMAGEKERLGYPTQKPEGLLERIIKTSSKEGDLVLDPFCGCGTTIAVAERLNRRWIGIDITHLAIALIKHRLEDTFGKDLSPYEVIGVPQDLKSAEALAEQDRFQFQYWALGLVDARPVGEKKKGADEGIDGYIYFFDDTSGKPKKAIVSVKSGHVTVSQIRDLVGVLEREKAEIGAFITLREPTEPMKKEALAAGYYEPEIFAGKQKFPRVQILTIKELLEGKRLEIPRLALDTFKKAPSKSKKKADQLSIE